LISLSGMVRVPLAALPPVLEWFPILGRRDADCNVCVEGRGNPSSSGAQNFA